jgi:hypothetical protein
MTDPDGQKSAGPGRVVKIERVDGDRVDYSVRFPDGAVVVIEVPTAPLRSPREA